MRTCIHTAAALRVPFASFTFMYLKETRQCGFYSLFSKVQIHMPVSKESD
uniref:Uncharacterized protein n=1 Tax=Arundo donax TaxID=35708 RepID=A0A0A8ZUA3_ARUDO